MAGRWGCGRGPTGETFRRLAEELQAARAIGQERQVRRSINEGKGGEPATSSFTETLEASCPPQTFQRLKTGGRRHRRVVEAIVNQAARTFLDRHELPAKPLLIMSNAKTRPSGFLVSLAALAAGAGAAYLDFLNAPAVAPPLDALTGRLYAWLPILQSFPPLLRFAVSGAEACVAVLLLGTALVAVFGRHHDQESRAEIQLKKRGKDPKAHRAGFFS